MWISTGGLWPGRSGAQSQPVQTQAGPLYMGRASHTKGALVSQRTWLSERGRHKQGGCEGPRQGLSASAREFHRARPAQGAAAALAEGIHFQRSLVAIRRGRGRGVGAEMEEREKGRGRDRDGGNRGKRRKEGGREFEREGNGSSWESTGPHSGKGWTVGKAENR